MTRARQGLAFTFAVWRLVLRDRSAAFFMLFLPVFVIVVVGATFGAQGQLRIGVVTTGTPDPDGLVAEVVGALEAADDLEVVRYDDLDEVRQAVRRFDLAAGVGIPADLDDLGRLDGAEGRGEGRGEVALITLPTGTGAFAARLAVQGAVDAVSTEVTVARVVAAETGVDGDRALEAARSVDAAGAVTVRAEDVGASARDLSRFSLAAPQNLVLFTFINALAASGVLVMARRDGVLRRALAAPVPTSVVVAGVALGWFAVALVQSVLILVIGAVFFGVDWGDPLAAAALVVTFAAVGCGAGLVVATLARDPDRVGTLGPPVGIVLAALGGCMIPLEVFPDSMLAVARAVPHYWAMVGWQRLVFDGGDLGDVAGPVAVLVAFALVLLTTAAALLRRDLRRPSAAG